MSLLSKRQAQNPPAKYQAFENHVVGQTRAYWRTNSLASLDSALRAVVKYNADVSRHVFAGQQVTSFDGWLGNRGGFAVRIRRLGKINPGYKIVLKKHRRPDVDLNLGSSRLASGFIVHAVGSTELPSFAFGVTDHQGNFCPLTASNRAAEEDLESFWPKNGRVLPTTSTAASTPLGYIDTVTQSPQASGDKSTWLAAMVNRFPAEMYEVVQRSKNPELAAVLTELLGGLVLNAEWADRFGMLAAECPGNRRSTLTPLQVWRVEAGGGVDLPASSAPRPVHVRRRDVVTYHAGPEILPVPLQRWLLVKDATVQDGGTVVAGGRLIVYDASADPRLDFVSGQWDSVFGSGARPDRVLIRRNQKAPERIPTGVLLAGRNDANWYHWLIEYLPRVFQFDESIPADAPLIVTSRTPRNGIEALREITTDREILVIDAALAQEVGELHVLAPPVQVLDTTRIPWAHGLSMNPVPLREFRARLGLVDRRLAGAGRRIFLRRTSPRRGLSNEAELAEIAHGLGLDLVDPAELNWREQVELFSSSSLVVGAGGAVMANYLLMTPESRILALTSDALADFLLPAAIGGIPGAVFSYVTGPNDSALEDHVARNNWLHSTYSVPAARFKRALLREIASLGPQES